MEFYELQPAPSVNDSLLKFADQPGCLLLDSARGFVAPNKQPLGRYSFLTADPFDTVTIPASQQQPFSQIENWLQKFRTASIPGLPPFQGGVAGLFSYDLNQSLESIPKTRFTYPNLPAVAVGCYDTVIAWDHQQGRAWIVSTGFPETNSDQQRSRARQRIQQFQEALQRPPVSQNPYQGDEQKLELDKFGPQNPVESFHGLVSNFSPKQYKETVKRCIDHIYAGDVFQINLAQQLRYPANCDSVSLYHRLRHCNPAPFAGYFDLRGISGRDIQIISASPERLASVRDRIVETRPIKGTRPRTGTPIVDLHAQSKLEGSVKDRAENTMIVDLMRNDLSRCCEDDSINVTQMCQPETYQSVIHLVSAIEGRLRSDCGLIDLVESIFPGGSITGAPKIRAMELIAELEPNARGAYCGSLGYLGFDGNADLNILIRTITASDGWWQIPVGGGIVSQSNPEHEYKETWAKAASLLQAVKG